jgi:hypothetical protein
MPIGNRPLEADCPPPLGHVKQAGPNGSGKSASPASPVVVGQPAIAENPPQGIAVAGGQPVSGAAPAVDVSSSGSAVPVEPGVSVQSSTDSPPTSSVPFPVFSAKPNEKRDREREVEWFLERGVRELDLLLSTAEQHRRQCQLDQADKQATLMLHMTWAGFTTQIAEVQKLRGPRLRARLLSLNLARAWVQLQASDLGPAQASLAELRASADIYARDYGDWIAVRDGRTLPAKAALEEFEAALRKREYAAHVGEPCRASKASWQL